MAEGQGRSSRQELKLLYLRDYFYKYTNKDNPKRMDAILKFLASNGIPASRVTVYNDIEILRNALHIPIKYSAKHYGYYVEKPQFESHEMLMLLDCIRFSTFITEDETESLLTFALVALRESGFTLDLGYLEECDGDIGEALWFDFADGKFCSFERCVQGERASVSTYHTLRKCAGLTYEEEALLGGRKRALRLVKAYLLEKTESKLENLGEFIRLYEE